MAYTAGASSTINVGQLTVTGSAALVIAANSNRRSIVLTNSGGSSMFIGGSSGVTTGGGYLLPAGSSISFTFHVGAIWVIGTAGVISWCEESG